MSTKESAAIFVTAAGCVVRVSKGRVRHADVHPESRLVEDLGVDSVRLIELKNELEDDLCIVELPVQDLFDSVLAEGVPLTMSRLVQFCAHALGTSATERARG